MPDELDTFFAKKKNKDKKKKNVLHVGDIAEYLDHTTRNLELLEREEKEQRHNEKEAKEGENGEEDSEWLEAPEEDISTKFAEIGIKDMDVSELTEDEEECEVKAENIATKTWKNPAEAAPAETLQYTIQTSKKYVPPVGRTSRRVGAGFDLKNEEMFPSIANADKIEKVEKHKVEDRKTVKVNQQAGWKTQENKAPNVYRPPQNLLNHPQISNASNVTAATAPVSAPVKTNKYVPPAKRNI
uniref:Protein CDV3 homolog n=1 Tax=Panagrolaimus superbus TaxID=310955 RepID=A0A914ZF03_9BILA